MRALPLLTLLVLAFVTPAASFVATLPVVSVTTAQPHRGWNDAIILRNAAVEVVVVPSVGRVMQFRFVGENEGPFWENE